MKKILTLYALVLCIALAICGAAAAESMIPDSLPTEFFDWNALGTYTGAILAVLVLTQFTKEIPYINKIPTQLWSYALALILLIASKAFTGGLTASEAALAAFNAALVSAAANGSYAVLMRAKPPEVLAEEVYEAPLQEEEIDIEISHWTLEQLQAFCIMNHVPAEGCETREQYMDAIEKHFAEGYTPEA